MSESRDQPGVVSLELLQAAMETMRLSIIITEPQLDLPGPRIVYSNPAFSELTGWSREEILGQTPRILQGPATDREVVGLLKRQIAAGQVFHGETFNYRKDGSPFMMEWNVAPIFDGAGETVYYVAVQRDITHRYELLQRIARAQREWETTVDAVSDMIVLEDQTGAVVRANRAVARYLDSELETLPGRNLGSLFLGREGAEIRSTFREPSSTLHLPGDERWFEVTNYPLDGGGEQLGSWVHVLRDITERRRWEAETRRLEAAVEQAVEAIAILDPGGITVYVNPAFEAMTGFGRADLLGQELYRQELGPLDPVIVKEVRLAMRTGRVWQGQYEAKRRDGSLYREEAVLSPIRGESGAIINLVLLCRDVTERKRLESIAESVNMMESVGFMFASLRHELGNPINSIKTALSVLRENLGSTSQDSLERYLGLMLDELGRVEYLLRVLRSFNLHEKPRCEAVELGEFLNHFAGLIRSQMEERGIGFEVIGLPTPAPALADPRALHQILLNLLVNAADATEGKPRARIELRLEERRGRYDLVVADNGRGLTEAELAKLFRPFYTSKPQGTGLGLVIVKKLVTSMGGTVEVTSMLGERTEVRVSLAAAESR